MKENMKNFNEMGLPEALNHTLQHLQFNEPTPIQADSIPLALAGKDILGSAQTGTGKTGAFGIPLVTKLLLSPQGSALVMTPTRELATQVMSNLKSLLGKQSKIKTALLIGGESMPKQFQQLRTNPRLIVGTPGRINDHLQRKSLKLSETDFLVLDETDRMLDMGFTIQIENVMQYMPAKRQTLLFSATLPKNIVRIAEKYLTDPVRVAVASESVVMPKIKQETLKVSEGDKYTRLLEQLDERQGSIIMFVKTKYGTERMAKRLRQQGYQADVIHGDLKQNRRNRVISDFRSEKFRILVATDVAARGLDIPHIEHVINYDLPQCAEDYIHRVGRTARAGAEGNALNLVSPADRGKWIAIERMLNPGAASSQDRGETGKKRSFQSRRRIGNRVGIGDRNSQRTRVAEGKKGERKANSQNSNFEYQSADGKSNHTQKENGKQHAPKDGAKKDFVPFHKRKNRSSSPKRAA